MTRFIALACFSLFLPSLVFAGAWPRTEGEAFLSVKAGRSEGADPSYALYSEFGATERLTLGFSADRHTPRTGHGELFARFALRPDKPLQIASEFSLGLAFDPRPPSWPVMADRVDMGGAIMAGRGFQTPIGDGWGELRLGRRSSLDQLRHTTEAKLTAGIAPADRVKLFLEVEHEATGAESFTSLGSNVAYRAIEDTHVVLGYAVDPSGELPARVDLGIWLAF